MGKLSSAIPAPASPAPSGAAPGLKLRGINMGGAQMVDPNAEAQVTAATTTAATNARMDAEQRQRAQEGQAFLTQMSAVGKPYSDLGIDDVMKITNGDLETAKRFADLKKTFQEGQALKVENVAPAINAMFGLLDKIPTAPGMAGRAMKYVNKGMAAVGEMPELQVYQNTLGLIAPMMSKAMGNVGNLSDRDIKAVSDSLQTIATGTTQERKLQKQLIITVMENAARKKWVDMVGAKATHKDLSTQDLIKMLGVQ